MKLRGKIITSVLTSTTLVSTIPIASCTIKTENKTESENNFSASGYCKISFKNTTTEGKEAKIVGTKTVQIKRNKMFGTVKQPVATLEKHTFKCWAKKTNTADGFIELTDFSPITDNTDLYPVFTSMQIDLKLDVNGGTLPEGKSSVLKIDKDCEIGSKLDEYKPTAPDGYSFIGWQIKDTTRFVDASTRFYSSTTLVAQYETTNIDLILNPGIGSINVILITVPRHASGLVVNQLLTEKVKVIAPEGYSFINWTTPEGKDVDKVLTFDNETTLIAKYENLHLCTVSFACRDTNGTISSIAPQKVPSGTNFESLTLPTTSPKTGYKFNNWTDVDGNTITTITSSMIIYANFIEDTSKWCTVTFTAGSTGATLTGPKTQKIIKGTTFSNVARPTAIKSDYEFRYWCLNGSSTTEFPASSTISSNITLVPYFVNEATSLRNKFYINLTSNDNTATEWYISNPSSTSGDIILVNRETKATKNISRESFNYPVYIGSKVKVIPDYFLYGCTSFNQQLNIPNSVTKISDYFMFDCRAFSQTLSIPSSVISIGNRFFGGAYTLSSGALDFTKATSLQSIGNDFLYDNDKFNKPLDFSKTKLVSIGNYFMANTTGAGDPSPFNSSIAFPSTLKTIGNNFFYNSYNFNNRLDLKNVNTIGDNFLYGCTNFNNEVILTSTQTIGNNFMAGCTKFNDGLFLYNVRTIGDCFMQFCSSFNSDLNLGSYLYKVGTYFLSYCTNFGYNTQGETITVQYLVIPASLTTIGHSFMFGCDNFCTIWSNSSKWRRNVLYLSGGDTQAYQWSNSISGCSDTEKLQTLAWNCTKESTYDSSGIVNGSLWTTNVSFSTWQSTNMSERIAGRDPWSFWRKLTSEGW